MFRLCSVLRRVLCAAETWSRCRTMSTQEGRITTTCKLQTFTVIFSVVCVFFAWFSVTTHFCCYRTVPCKNEVVYSYILIPCVCGMFWFAAFRIQTCALFIINFSKQKTSPRSRILLEKPTFPLQFKNFPLF